MNWQRIFLAGSIVLCCSLYVAQFSAVASEDSHFSNLPPGAPLPSGTQCADWVRSSSSAGESRRENTSANSTLPTADELAVFHARPLFGASVPTADFARVDGNFTGSTDQILRWAACKWGIDEDLFRAQAWTESKWKQATAGDERNDPKLCHAGAWNGWDGSKCKQSYGILQVKMFDFNTWPEARDSTAFNADFRAAFQRACVNGDVHYLSERTPLPPHPRYPTSDPDAAAWGCIGNWYSGGWFDTNALKYIDEVKRDLASRPWARLRGGS